MNLGDFKKTVAAYMTREEADFVYGGVDLLLSAANNARKWAERRHDFEYCRGSAVVKDVHFEDGGSLATALSWPGGTEPVLVKKVERAFMPVRGAELGAVVPIDIFTRKHHLTTIQRKFEGTLMFRDLNMLPLPPAPAFSFVQHGERFYIAPASLLAWGDAVVDIYLDVVKWLPDYAAPTDTDFFLTYNSEFMLFKTVEILNFRLKEDQRVMLSKAMMADSWQTVKEWDTSLVASVSDDLQLD